MSYTACKELSRNLCGKRIRVFTIVIYARIMSTIMQRLRSTSLQTQQFRFQPTLMSAFIEGPARESDKCERKFVLRDVNNAVDKWALLSMAHGLSRLESQANKN